MAFSSARTGLHLAAPVVAVVVLSACALQEPARLTPYSSFTDFSQRQIAAVSPITAYDAVARLRPAALNYFGGSAFEPTVYIDGLRLGGLEQLQRIPALDLVEIRFLTPIEASARFGPSQRNGGAILLMTRLGQKRMVY